LTAVIGVFVGLGFAFLGLLVLSSWFSVRPPRVPLFFSPGSVGAPQEDVEFSADGVTIRAWWIDAEGEAVAILAHGYLMNRSELSPLAVWLHERGVSSLALDFPAHGASGGRRCTFGVREAGTVAAAVRWVRAKRDGARVVLIGSSMGGAACGFALSEERELAEALILDCAYSRLWVSGLGWWRFVGGRALAVVLSPTLLLGWAMSGVNPFRVDLARALERARPKPVLLIHGDADILAPPSEVVRNLKASGENSRIVWLKGCGHAEGRWLDPATYYRAIEEFLAEIGFLKERRP
jgi:pimeloyl-ACP methyl ester carboxylesterase